MHHPIGPEEVGKPMQIRSLGCGCALSDAVLGQKPHPECGRLTCQLADKVTISEPLALDNDHAADRKGQNWFLRILRLWMLKKKKKRLKFTHDTDKERGN